MVNSVEAETLFHECSRASGVRFGLELIEDAQIAKVKTNLAALNLFIKPIKRLEEIAEDVGIKRYLRENGAVLTAPVTFCSIVHFLRAALRRAYTCRALIIGHRHLFSTVISRR
jgi:hypothetical protein